MPVIRRSFPATIGFMLFTALALTTPSIAGEVPGLVGEYFVFDALSDFPKVPANLKPTLVRVDATVDFADITGPFHGTRLTENFYARWTGVLRIEKAGSYGFATESDDGSRLTIDGKAVVENGGVHAEIRKGGKIELTAGDHQLLIEYFQGGGGAGCKVSWQPPGGNDEPLSPKALFHAKAAEDIAWDKDAWGKLKAAPAKVAKVTGKFVEMDHGPFLTATVESPFPRTGNIAMKGLAIHLDADKQATCCFDTELLRMTCGWNEGYVQYPGGRDGLEGHPQVAGTPRYGTNPGPGWAKAGGFADPREKGQGPLPADWAKYRGLYLNGNQVVLSYTVGESSVSELPGYLAGADGDLFTRTLVVANAKEALTLLVCERDGAAGEVVSGAAGSSVAILSSGDEATVVGVVSAPAGATLAIANGTRILLNLPAGLPDKPFIVAVWTGAKADTRKAEAALAKVAKPVDPRTLRAGGPARWTEPVTTVGELGKGPGAYVVDTLPVPYDNPWKCYMRTTGVDFFSDGRAAISTIDGDVWVVSGIDADLAKISWKRYASGLFQALGLRIVGDQVYVIGRDQITCLRDLNNDGEADFYQCFNNDCVVTNNYHEFALDLDVDKAGNFYYCKGSPWPPTVTSPHQGCLMRVTADGKRLEVIATGLRAPNGMAVGPHDEITFSDNQGHWTPVCRLNWVKEGGFYGMTPAAHRPAPPTDYDLPLFWIPMNMDNSSGGQVWAPAGDRWGPLGGQLLFESYGKSTLFNVMYEEVDGVRQAGVCQLPLSFTSGLMRARFRPQDGQLYVTGMQGWQTNAAKAGNLQRVRYTGQPLTQPVALHVHANGISVGFAIAVDKALAGNKDNYGIEQWNYHWTANYGSDDYKLSDPKAKGHDQLPITGVTIAADGKSVFLELAEVKPCMQMRVKYKIAAADGTPMAQEIYNSIFKVPATKGP